MKKEVCCKECGRAIMSIDGILFVDIPKPGHFLEAQIRCSKCKAFTKIKILNKLQCPDLGWASEESLYDSIIEF